MADVKKKLQLKKKTKINSPIEKPLSINGFEHSLQPRFSTTINPEYWVMSNRVKFVNWLDVLFKYAPGKMTQKQIEKQCNCVDDGSSASKCFSTVKAIHLFPYQQFVIDYIQFASPYRGVLLYHSLGSGKSATSIAAAEVLSTNMKVIAMTPASLQGNFIEEIKKYGRSFYQYNQKWMWHSLQTDQIHNVSLATHLPAALLKKQKGIWVPSVESNAKSFSSLTDSEKSVIENQVDTAIRNRVQFINYNGLTRNKIAELTKNGNIFDNACVIIDEVHNLISRVVNGRQLGSAIYKLLYQAKNCKIILLTGTPIINYPHEIARIVNLLTGPQKQYELLLKKGTSLQELNKVLAENKYIDHYNIAPNGQRAFFRLLPYGFEAIKQPSQVVRSDSPKELEDVLNELTLVLQKTNISFKRIEHLGETLPSNEKEFNDLFIDEQSNILKNQTLFMKRILGTVSFFETFNPEHFPSVEVQEVIVNMTDFQFSTYENSRDKEIKKEKRASKFKKSNSIFKDDSQVYRFYSRANCNFVFPPKIKRPFPTSNSVTKAEIDFASEEEEKHYADVDEVSNADNSPVVLSKRSQTLEYIKQLNEALEKLQDESNEHLTLESLNNMYSPKFAEIIKRISQCPGTALVYSQFKKVEGLGILGMALEVQGWTQLKVKKEREVWHLDVSDKDLQKPMYCVFSGNNDESKMLLKIFNGELETIPANIKNKLQSSTNLHGEIVKVMMITQSGAEGISLKNVRQVHILEPYWNNVRISQVIGRAVRTCSHIALPPSEQNVTVYKYITKLTDKQISQSFTLNVKDKRKTTDQHIYDIAMKKTKIVNSVLESVRNASVDCAINAKYHKDKGLKCFSFPVNMSEELLTHEFDIKRDKPFLGLQDNQWEGKVMITKKGNFLIHPNTQDVYDFDLFLESHRLVKIGRFTEEGDHYRIVFT